MNPLTLPTGNAICYSGYRQGQSPCSQIYPSVDEIGQDLAILQKHWSLLRLYDCSLHAERVLEVIRRDALPFRVMLGANLAAEVNNPSCPWASPLSPEQLQANQRENAAEILRLMALANRYPELVFAASVGNEATVDWTDHLVPVLQVIHYVRQLKRAIQQPVTFCENYVPWQGKLRDLVPELDFISLHTYPLWEYKHVQDAVAYSQDNYNSVAELYPNTPVVITEAGWATRSNGRGMHAEAASPEWQGHYYQGLMAWTRAAGILTFVFEAFDEPWKGSADPLEPEKHWGLFTVDRQPKPVMHQQYPDMLPTAPRAVVYG